MSTRLSTRISTRISNRPALQPQQQAVTRKLPAWALAVMLVMPVASHAQVAGISDTANDFLPTFGGSSASKDLDVLSASVLYDVSTDQFKLISTMNGAIGSTATGFYVWGVNRGAGTAGFAANGLPGVRFDTVVLLRPAGNSTIGATTLPAGSVVISGNTITATVSGALLPGTGFANKLDYTWNLWPRDGAFTGFAAISDFAPDNANFTSTPGSVIAVPEPGTLAMWMAGLGMAALLGRRRAARLR